MATIKTIKPAGGGDYTTLAAWENWADGQASADQWAECYEGGDLGPVLLNLWTPTPTPTLYPKIYTPLAERHNGTSAGGGDTVEYLIIGGGGAGGTDVVNTSWYRGGAGGGGAGGFRTNVSGATSGGGASAESAMSISTGS